MESKTEIWSGRWWRLNLQPADGSRPAPNRDATSVLYPHCHPISGGNIRDGANGHPAPLLIRGGDVRELSGRALPILTYLHCATIEPFTVDLAGDWGLLLFTDGLVEGRAKPGSTDRFGVDELARQLQSLVEAGISRTDQRTRTSRLCSAATPSWSAPSKR